MDFQAVRTAFTDHLRHSLSILHRDGYVIGLSGGIDSSLTAHLAVEAVGRDRVMGIILPERESSAESEALARDLANTLGIRHQVVDVSRSLEALNAYELRDTIARNYFAEYDPAQHRLGISLHQDLLGSYLPAVHYIFLSDPAGSPVAEAMMRSEDYFKIVAATNFKQRIRALQLYYHADGENYAVLGTTNRDELVLGFFVKLGDGAADVEAIDILYKSEIFALAREIGVDSRIVERTPTTDTLPGQPTQEGYFYGLPFALLDIGLKVFEGELSPSQAAVTARLEEGQIDRLVHNLKRRNETTRILRTPGMSLERDSVAQMLS